MFSLLCVIVILHLGPLLCWFLIALGLFPRLVTLVFFSPGRESQGNGGITITSSHNFLSQLHSPLTNSIICLSNVTVRQMIRLFRAWILLHLELIPYHQPTHHFRFSVGTLFTATRAFKSFLIPLSCHSWVSRWRLLKVTVRLTSKEATRYRWNLPLSSQCHPGLTTLGGSVGQRGRGRCAFEPRLEYSAFSQGVTRLTPTALGRPVPS